MSRGGPKSDGKHEKSPFGDPDRAEVAKGRIFLRRSVKIMLLV